SKKILKILNSNGISLSNGTSLSFGSGGLAVALSVISYPFVAPAFRRICLPYVPATPSQIRNITAALRGRKGTLVDLGSGDGRVVLAAAKLGFNAVGVELNPWLVAYSKLSARAKGLSSNATFYRKDLFQYDLSNADNVVIFGVEEMMGELGQRLASTLRPTSIVIACRFPLPNAKAEFQLGNGIDTVWVYRCSLMRS
ncbi:unnamed protein product, partial [Cyprideis torosa]